MSSPAPSTVRRHRQRIGMDCCAILTTSRDASRSKSRPSICEKPAINVVGGKALCVRHANLARKSASYREYLGIADPIATCRRNGVSYARALHEIAQGRCPDPAAYATEILKLLGFDPAAIPEVKDQS